MAADREKQARKNAQINAGNTQPKKLLTRLGAPSLKLLVQPHCDGSNVAGHCTAGETNGGTEGVPDLRNSRVVDLGRRIALHQLTGALAQLQQLIAQAWVFQA